ncbi:TsaE protein, required for threonylcarbamoyladenosine t(6)A37 formation in tRNA [hydrothermal vent metagenome]|uniref:tRNA threonylcarbamoyladenosine biosynthesis protein TsaE n=1 Tax=hydrothermal vent metagenome TaxID=652676 RepID=A0A1W1BBK4_9ZZZZ
MKIKKIKASRYNLNKVTKYLNENLPENIIIFLVGNLASGKTTLSSAIAKSKGIKEGVTSPTFSLQQYYGDKLYHYDLYRIDNESFFNLGLHEELDKDGWHLIEWADEYLQSFIKGAGYKTVLINIEYSDDLREYIIYI